MALEGLSGAKPAYSDAAMLAQGPKAERSVKQEPNNTTDMNITEIPSGVRAVGNIQPVRNQEKGQGENPASERKIRDAISTANSKMKYRQTRCEFSYHEETNRVSIRVLDNVTEEVLREIPPEETLEMLERIWELAGLLVDERR